MAPQKPPLRALLEAQAKELGNLERQQQGVALKLYIAARAEVMQGLEHLEGDSGAMTPRKYAKANAGIVASINDYGHSFRVELGRMVKPAAQLSSAHLGQQFKLWAPKQPSLNVGEAIAKVQPLLTPQFDARVNAYAQRLKGDMQQRLALSMLAGEDGATARKRLVTGYLSPIPASIRDAVERAASASVRTALDDSAIPNMTAFGKVQPLRIASGLTEWSRDIPGPAYWAQKVITDAVVRTNGSAAVALIGQAADTLPKIQKRWVSVIDDRTSDMCLGLDGETIDIDDVFDADGEDVMSPPGHINCRSTVSASDPSGAIAFDAVDAYEQ